MAKELLSKISKTTLAGTAVDIGFAFMDYNQARDEGKGVVQSIGSAAIEFALPTVMGTIPYIGMELLGAAGSLAVDLYDTGTAKLRQADKQARNQSPFKNYTFVSNDTMDKMRVAGLSLAQEAINGNFTMRQNGIMMAKNSRYMAQETSFGNEAMYL